MSRHDIPARNSQYTVAVGWDPPLRTYFCQIKDLSLDEEADTVLWVGASFDEIQSVPALMLAIRDYADISEDLAFTLFTDRLQPD